MKPFAIAFGIVCGGAAVLFGLAFALLSLVAPLQTAASTAVAPAGAVIAAFPKVAELLEQQESRKRLAAGSRKPVYDFLGFQITWPLMVVYGTIALSFLGQVAGGVAGLMLGLAGSSFEGENAPNAGGAMGILTIIVTIFGAYFVGRWVGARTSRLGIVTMLLIAPITAALQVGLDVLFVPDEVYRGLLGSERLAFFGILVRIATISFLIIVPGLIGYWRGHRQRLSKYLNYLLSVLPPQTRDVVVGLAYEEAQKVVQAMRGVRASDRA
jgi:hypothetical protein